uniref:Peptidase aspartic putative domain-containing protein n=1 Tax=Panagrolaimus davidi TaxID=227884 RepID=A0A914Q433_9BILA
MSFKSKPAFTNARKRAWELCTQAAAEYFNNSSSGLDCLSGASNLLALRLNIVKEQTACKDYHQQWVNSNEEIRVSNPSKFAEENAALEELFAKTDGINALYAKISESLIRLDELILNAVNETHRLLQPQVNDTPQPSAPVETPSTPNAQQVAPIPPPIPTTDPPINAPAIPTSSLNPAFPPIATQQPQHVTFAPQNPQANVSTSFDAYAPNMAAISTHSPSILQAVNSQQIASNSPASNPAFSPTSTAPQYPPLQSVPLICQQRFFNIPKADLGSFNGNPKDYRFWWESYRIIHDDPTIDNMNKHRILNGLLKGKAKEAVRFYDINYTNYPLVVKDLYNQFGRKQLILDALFNDFKSINIFGNNIEDIEKAVISLESILKQLETEGVILDDGTWKMLYSEKIPARILQMVNLYGLEPTFTELRDRVLLVVRAERNVPGAQLQTSQHPNHYNAPHRAPYQNFKPLMASDLYRPKYERQKSTDKDCVFCGKHNNSYSCNTVPEIKERKRIANAKDLCFKCLQPGHSGSTCKDVRPCLLCKGNHNAAFCFASEKPSSMHAVNTVNIKIPTHSKDVAMMVKPAPVCNPHRPLLEKEANIFFDGGSTASFIKESLVMQLKLPIIQEENLFLQKFAENNNPAAPPIPSKKVKMLIKTVHMETVEVIAYTVKRISDVLPVINSSGMHQSEPDILIGNDYCWTFLPSKKLSNGYSEVTTLLGKIICGQKDQSVSNSSKSFTEETSPSISYEKELELNSQVKRMQQKIKDMEALFVTTEDDLLAEIQNDSMKTKLHKLSTQNDHYRIALKENATLKEDLNFFMATVDELKEENQILKTEKSRDSSTIKSLRSLLINVRDLYEEASSKHNLQEEEINKLALSNSGLIEEKKQQQGFIIHLQNEIQNLTIFQQPESPSLFQELQEAENGKKPNFNEDDFNEDDINEDEVPRGKWRMEKVIEVKESRVGHISTVIVKTTNGNLINRSPVQLYPLEANLDPKSRKASKVEELNPISLQAIENCSSISEPVNQISLFHELQEFNAEIKQTSQSYTEKPEVPRGSKFMQNLAEHRTYETESKADKPIITPLAAAAAPASGRKLLPAFSPLKEEKFTNRETNKFSENEFHQNPFKHLKISCKFSVKVEMNANCNRENILKSLTTPDRIILWYLCVLLLRRLLWGGSVRKSCNEFPVYSIFS